MEKFKMMIKKENVNYVEIFKTCDKETRRNYMYNILLNNRYDDSFIDVVNQYNEYAGIFEPEEVADAMNISLNCFRILLSYDEIMRYDKLVLVYVYRMQRLVQTEKIVVLDNTFKDMIKSDYIMSVVRSILEAIGYKIWLGFIDIINTKEGDLPGKCRRIPTYIITDPDEKGNEVLENLVIIEKSRGHF